eukprot:TRINITY_DN58815_c0_g1_i1.p1 TRINITY_DN58815_c0_g1~~TRINITY_DN58815_c0_g1_i1.p1  ORF type:complete len:536 (-),score=83.86 TRINITY_DN58815_c0_g1_i1:278-1858(-)
MLFSMLSVVFALAVSAASVAVDEGFELLVKSNPEQVNWTCQPVPGLPRWINGTLILPSAAQFEMGEQRFQTILDSFGKFHKMQLSNGSLCFMAKMLPSKFYNDSLSKDGIAPGFLFDEPIPPRHCTVPRCNLFGGNDNTFVKTYKVGDTYLSVTDSPIMQEFDPTTLDVVGKVAWKDDFKDLPAHMALLAAAHAIIDPETGNWYGVQQEASLSGRATVDLYTIDPAVPKRKQLLSRKITEKMRYFHDLGMSKNYVILPFQPYTFNAAVLFSSKPMKEALVLDNKSTEFHVFSRSHPQAEPQVFTVDRFFYQHVSNAYENETGIIIDLGHNERFVLHGPLAYVEPTANKSERDSSYSKFTMRRYHLHLNGPKSGQVTSEILSDPSASTEFVRINEAFKTRPYCFYYANEWFHKGSAALGAMAVVKQDMCTGRRYYWARPAHYPSEPVYVPRGDGEDDGSLLFSSLDGTTGKSSLIVVDAKNLAEIAAVELPTRLPYTMHPTWFPGLVQDDAEGDDLKSEAAHDAVWV